MNRRNILVLCLSIIIIILSLVPSFYKFPLGFGILFLLPLAIIVFLMPSIGVAFLFLLLPFSFSSKGISYSEILFSVILFVSVIGGLIKSFTYRVKSVFYPSFFLPLFFLIFSILISYFPALSNSVTALFWLRRSFPFLLFLTAIPVFVDLKTKEKITLPILLGTSSLISFLNSMKILFHWSHDVSLIATESNVQTLRLAGNGVYMLFSPLLCIFLLMVVKNIIIRVILHVILFLSIIALLLTYTRSYWLGAFFSFIFLLFFLKGREKKRFIKIVFVQFMIGLIIFAFLYGANPIVQHKISLWVNKRASSIFAFSKTLSGEDRLQEIKALIPLILKSPIWGYGLGAKYTFYSVNPFSWHKLGYVAIWYSHNFYAYHLFATGIIGLGSFLFFLLENLVLSIRIYYNRLSDFLGSRLVILLSALIIGLMFTSFTSPQFIDKPSNLYVAVAVGITWFEYYKILNKKRGYKRYE